MYLNHGDEKQAGNNSIIVGLSNTECNDNYDNDHESNRHRNSNV